MKKITTIIDDRQALKNKIRVVAYCRVSTTSDEQLISLSAQKEHYENFIKANSQWEYAGLYYDEGISGTKKDRRKGLLSMIADCEKGKIDLILTKSISRFCRNTTDCLALVRKLLDLNVCIYFEKENLNTGQMEGELMLSILSSLAENESMSISQNEKWSIKKRFENGTYIISYPPYGYANVEGKMVIVSEEAEIVKEIFNGILSGKSTHMIAKDFNDNGVPTKRGGKWSAGSVNAIIKNEKYTGDAIFQKTYTDDNFNRHTNYEEYDRYLVENHHEPIISHDLYEKANNLLKQRGKEKGNGEDTGKYQNRYSFSGKMKCGECGSSFKRRIHSKPSGDYVAWCCCKHIQNKAECSMKYITDEAVKRAFVMMMNKLAYGNKKILSPLLNEVSAMDQEESNKRLIEIDKLLHKNAEQREVISGLAEKKILNQRIYKNADQELLDEAQRLKDEKKKLSYVIQNEADISEEIRRLTKYCDKHQKSSEFDEEAFNQFVLQITVYSREEVGFELKCGLTLKERL